MNALKQAVRTYARCHANRDGLAVTTVPGLRTMCVEDPAGDLHSVYGHSSVSCCKARSA